MSVDLFGVNLHSGTNEVADWHLTLYWLVKGGRYTTYRRTRSGRRRGRERVRHEQV